MHVIEQTRDEKIAMYMKLTKRELAEMFASANEAIDSLTKEKPARWVQMPSWRIDFGHTSVSTNALNVRVQ